MSITAAELEENLSKYLKLSETEDFGYSFDLTRLDDISSMCCGFDDGACYGDRNAVGKVYQ